MNITAIETFIVNAGWRPWTFVKVETDEGVKSPGWGADINEDVARAYPWDITKVGYSKSTPPPKSF